MSADGNSDTQCKFNVSIANTTCSPKELSITSSAISMTVGILSNSLALFILVKSYRLRLKAKASFLLFASGLVVTDLMGHLTNGTLVIYVYSSQRNWETFDPHNVLCMLFGACLVFFGLSPLFLGSAMAVERCIGVTRPLFHSTVVARRYMKRLLGFSWLLAALVALLPVLLWRPYQVQHSKSFCFFQMECLTDWLDMLLPLLFSLLGLLALLISIVFNMLTTCTLLLSRRRQRRHCRNSPHHLEMICQLQAIMVVACVCWGPLLIRILTLSTRAKKEPVSLSLLLLVRMATWNQIMDPWVYILLRKAVLKKLFLLHSCWGPGSHTNSRWKSSLLQGSSYTKTSVTDRPKSYCLEKITLPDKTIKSIC